MTISWAFMLLRDPMNGLSLKPTAISICILKKAGAIQVLPAFCACISSSKLCFKSMQHFYSDLGHKSSSIDNMHNFRYFIVSQFLHHNAKPHASDNVGHMSMLLEKKQGQQELWINGCVVIK